MTERSRASELLTEIKLSENCLSQLMPFRKQHMRKMHICGLQGQLLLKVCLIGISMSESKLKSFHDPITTEACCWNMPFPQLLIVRILLITAKHRNIIYNAHIT